ncbi:MAG: group I truncated hemoglobin [Verrucomicrobiales bacterium]
MAGDSTNLFDRVGGAEGVEHLVHAFYERVLEDPELGPFFQEVPLSHLQTMQKEFFSEALGGPLYYSGRSLRQVHAGRGITKAHLRRFTQHLLDTLQAERGDLELTDQDLHGIYSRIALEADRVTDDVAESG